jgi:hypothetical protein
MDLLSLLCLELNDVHFILIIWVLHICSNVDTVIAPGALLY